MTGAYPAMRPNTLNLTHTDKHKGANMPNISNQDAALRDILQRARVIAVVGHSDKPQRTSYQIARYLRDAGYRVIPVNPTVNRIEGEISYPSLAQIPEKVDIVNVFRRAEHLPEVLNQAVAVGASAVWGQLGVIHPEAGDIIAAHDLLLVMDRCIKVEHARLGV